MGIFDELKEKLIKNKNTINTRNLKMQDFPNEALVMAFLNVLENKGNDVFNVKSSEDVLEGLKMIYEQSVNETEDVKTEKRVLENKIAEMSISDFKKNKSFEDAVKEYKIARQEIIDKIEAIKTLDPQIVNQFYKELASKSTSQLVEDIKKGKLVRRYCDGEKTGGHHEYFVSEGNVKITYNDTRFDNLYTLKDCKKLDEMLQRETQLSTDEFGEKGYYDIPWKKKTNPKMDNLGMWPNELLALSFYEVYKHKVYTTKEAKLDWIQKELLKNLDKQYIIDTKTELREAQKNMSELKIKDFMKDNVTFAQAKKEYDDKTQNYQNIINYNNHKLEMNDKFINNLKKYEYENFVCSWLKERELLDLHDHVGFFALIGKDAVVVKDEYSQVESDVYNLLDKELSRKMDDVLARPKINKSSKETIADSLLK